MVDTISKDERSKLMSSIRSTHTKFEDAVARELWKRGIRFRRNTKKLVGRPDISIKKYKIVIFIDSCFWHSCEMHGRIPKSNTDFWVNKLTANKRRDREVTEYYQNLGWNILRIWEHDLVSDFSGTLDKIVDFIKSKKESGRL